ncbi:MAG: hypothetical protein ABIK65_09240 [Candidatus Eisenbacteria bacterium]
MRTGKTTPLFLSLAVIGLLVGAVPNASAVVNGDFEAGAAPWKGNGARVKGINLPIPPGVVPMGPQHAGWMQAGGVPERIRQTFDCVPPVPPPEAHCTVTFDWLFWKRNPGDVARVVLQSAGGVFVGIIPGANPPLQGHDSISIPGCVNPTEIDFYLFNPGNPPGFGAIKSVLVVDNVVCECLEGNHTTLQQGSLGEIPETVPPPDQDIPDREDFDCDEDGVYDFQELVEGTQVDENENWVPDDCEATGTESGSWGGVKTLFR